MDCCHITEILKNSYGKLSLVDFWAVHLVIHVKNGLSYMDSWAVANGVSCKSVPRRNRNGRSRSKISGEETCGSTDDSVHRMCGSLCRLIMLARDCELQRWHSTLGLQYVFPCVSHLCPLSPQYLHNGLMDTMIMVAGIKGVRLPRSWAFTKTGLSASLQNMQSSTSRDWHWDWHSALEVTHSASCWQMYYTRFFSSTV